jgi:hypothetical protein
MFKHPVKLLFNNPTSKRSLEYGGGCWELHIYPAVNMTGILIVFYKVGRFLQNFLSQDNDLSFSPFRQDNQ